MSENQATQNLKVGEFVPLSNYFVPQDILKKRRKDQQLQEEKAKQKLQQKLIKFEKNKEKFLKPETLIHDYKKQQKSYQLLKNKTKKINNHGIENASELKDKVLLVIRIRGNTGLCENVKKVLRSLRLPLLHTSTFIRVNSINLKRLSKVDKYVTYGIPSRKIISELIHKRGQVKINGEKRLLNSNNIIEELLGELNIICLEDLVHEIATKGQNFIQVMKFIKFFRLNPPKDGLPNVRKPVKDGGEWGYREDKINELIERLI